MYFQGRVTATKEEWVRHNAVKSSKHAQLRKIQGYYNTWNMIKVLLYDYR